MDLLAVAVLPSPCSGDCILCFFFSIPYLLLITLLRWLALILLDKVHSLSGDHSMHALPGGHTIASWWFLFILFISLPCWLQLILLDEVHSLFQEVTPFLHGGSGHSHWHVRLHSILSCLEVHTLSGIVYTHCTCV